MDNPVRFAGGYQDPALGGGYATPARMYDPGTGRFGGTDPVQPSLSSPAVSSYAYVADRPTAFTDPSGAKSQHQENHDAALALAVEERLAPLYGPQNVYGDETGLRSLAGYSNGTRIEVPILNPTPKGHLTGHPDIIALDGPRTLLYEIKPAADQDSRMGSYSYDVRGIENADQVQGYLDGLTHLGTPMCRPGRRSCPPAGTTPTEASSPSSPAPAGAPWPPRASVRRTMTPESSTTTRPRHRSGRRCRQSPPPPPPVTTTRRSRSRRRSRRSSRSSATPVRW
ncbi:hypothetical protein GXW82_17960 [Streptacidiphilus sp. 4-A2]|nr:hypothetical protein [Streptacidiphilus sp. 4-A2]